MEKHKHAAGLIHPSRNPKMTKPATAANKGKPTTKKAVKPLTKHGKYSGTS